MGRELGKKRKKRGITPKPVNPCKHLEGFTFEVTTNGVRRTCKTCGGKIIDVAIGRCSPPTGDVRLHPGRKRKEEKV